MASPQSVKATKRGVRRKGRTEKDGKANVLGFVLWTTDNEIKNATAVRWVAQGF